MKYNKVHLPFLSPLNSPYILPNMLPSNFISSPCSLFPSLSHSSSFENPISPISAAHMCMGMGPSTGPRKTYLWPQPQNEWFCLLHQLLHSSSVRGGAWRAPSSSLPEYQLTWSCVGFIQGTRAAVNSWGQEPRVQKIASHSISPILWLLHTFCTPPWALVRRGVDKGIQFKGEHSVS